MFVSLSFTSSQRLSALPKSYIDCGIVVLGSISLVTSVSNVIVSCASESPKVILPSSVILPSACISPLTSKLLYT